MAKEPEEIETETETEIETTPAKKETPRPHEVVNQDYVRRLKKAEKENSELRGVVDELSGKVDEQNQFLAKLRETPTGAKQEPAAKGNPIVEAIQEVKNFFFPPSGAK